MIVKKERKTKQNRKKKTQIKAATVRVHLLSQWRLTGHPEKKAGKQEQQCGCSSLARPRMAQSSLDEFANRSQLRAKCTRSSLSLLSSSHPPSTSRAILSIFEIKKKKKKCETILQNSGNHKKESLFTGRPTLTEEKAQGVISATIWTAHRKTTLVFLIRYFI